MPPERSLLSRWIDVDNEGDISNALKLSERERLALLSYWPMLARPSQLPPAGDWANWLILAGRGFGKTRAGAEWVRTVAEADPQARVALIAANLGEARRIMVEGQSGVLAVSGAEPPLWLPSLRRIEWTNGARAMLYSAADPESLRGPEHSHGWCDELAKWDQSNGAAQSAWDNYQMGLRLGDDPRTLITTTPRNVALLRKLLLSDRLALVKGRTADNIRNLPTGFVQRMQALYGNSALGRQEIDGMLLDEPEGALWTRMLLERQRMPSVANDKLVQIVVAVDPPASATGDACGLIVAGRDDSMRGFILADGSVEKASPETWARAAASLAEHWQADMIVAEANMGGAMVESVLRAAGIDLRVRLVHASRGKTVRAEPVAALYEAGRVFHAGMFGPLEDQLCGLMAGGGYQGPGRSPDRADALVWAVTELLLGRRGSPRIRG